MCVTFEQSLQGLSAPHVILKIVPPVSNFPTPSPARPQRRFRISPSPRFLSFPVITFSHHPACALPPSIYTSISSSAARLTL